ncbi:MAG: hypothetical protein M0R48_06315 [Candidatus Omnitrophica bacterium]|jgi:hypothetical protein|nr:hypothetical protein [Candidatus Omnitrophota bacterium]
MTEIENILKKYLTARFNSVSPEKDSNCPSEETLLDYMGNKLSGQGLMLIEEHISGCRFCLSQLSLAIEAKSLSNEQFPSLPKNLIEKAKNLIGIDKNLQAAKAARKRRMKKNLFLAATIIFFILSFIIHEYFMQFLAGALILGFRWAFESESGRTLIMVLDSWRKHSHDEDDEISRRLKDRFSKHDL